MEGHSSDRGVETEGQGRGIVEYVSARKRIRRGIDQPGIRAAVRDYGARAMVGRGLQLLGARHRQYGSPGPLRDRRAEETVADSAAQRRDSVLFRDDRT